MAAEEKATLCEQHCLPWKLLSITCLGYWNKEKNNENTNKNLENEKELRENTIQREKKIASEFVRTQKNVNYRLSRHLAAVIGGKEDQNA